MNGEQNLVRINKEEQKKLSPVNNVSQRFWELIVSK